MQRREALGKLSAALALAAFVADPVETLLKEEQDKHLAAGVIGRPSPLSGHRVIRRQVFDGLEIRLEDGATYVDCDFTCNRLQGNDVRILRSHINWHHEPAADANGWPCSPSKIVAELAGHCEVSYCVFGGSQLNCQVKDMPPGYEFPRTLPKNN